MKAITSFFCFVFTVILILSPAAQAQYVCQIAPNPIVIQGSINNGDVQQAGRLTRDGAPSTCGQTGSGTLENNTALRRDSHNFTNPFNETVCVRVDIDFSGCNAQTQSAAYSSYNPANPALNVIGDSGFSTINKGSYSFQVGPNANFTIVVSDIEDDGIMCALYKVKVSYLQNCRQPGFDKTNDGKADPTIYRVGSPSEWWTLDSSTNQSSTHNLGMVGDVITGANDYTGDGKTDLSVYRPSTSTWFYGIDDNTNYNATPWGISGDVRVPGDYDGDGKTDIAVWRPSDGTYYVLRSTDGVLFGYRWGTNGDRMVQGDFDGDTLMDFAIARGTTSGLVWYITKSNYNYGFDDVIQWGLSAGDTIVPADYDGDAITDIAVWRQSEGNFYVRRSSDLTMMVFKWGVSGDRPQPADYDGDKQADFAVFRPSTGTWYIHNSETGTSRVINFGQNGDLATTTSYRIP